MYKEYFGFVEMPFSIVPNSRYLFLSQRHQEAMQNLQAGLGEGGGFAMLTGEVGTGKTTVAKAMLTGLDEDTCAGLILNPTFSNTDLLEAICDEFDVLYPEQASLKQLSQAIHQFLLDNHAQDIQTLLVIDEAQHLAADVLEQLRLLTNLETDHRKLLKVLLVGQPELQQHLQTTQLRQLAQRITGRYHLLPLNVEETGKYIAFRLEMAGGSDMLFTNSSIKIIALHTHGIPRLINLVCDKALQLSFHAGEASSGRNRSIPNNTVQRACQQVMSFQAEVYHSPQVTRTYGLPKWVNQIAAALCGLGLAYGAYIYSPQYFEKLPFNQAEIADVPEVEIAARSVIAVQKDNGIPDDVKEALSAGKQRSIAIQSLYRLWGYKSSVRDGLCLSEPQSEFTCHQQKATLSELINANVPVVLNLELNQNPLFGVLYSASSDSVELLIRDQLVQLPIDVLNELWRGDYVAIWKQPLRQTLKYGYQGEAVTMLDLLLSEALGEDVSGGDVFDEELKSKVAAFQSWQGMTVDGIAGSRTLARLQKLTQLDAPVLATNPGEPK
ncbi:ExeA family protein [Vibrio sp. 99-70-13A1]|uniref:ExeA family protein n=1 Tax=Vibrio sp. 99-70-13A1 TaxID=2607601 RepID=UPI0014938CB8|nr:ExeA family protein [Vibrio sp. 99-70-13A1]NOH99116.1 AAA family ATPase [Vibrio sp. 99-70-13A1]